jgi:L-ascorbate metabolism protein UlaG (beta-lactamase superfamily)
MEITWIGHSCFRLRGKDATVITDPCARSSGYTLARAAAELVTVSNEHPNHAASQDVGGDPMVVSGPGEYEVHGVIVTGVRTSVSRRTDGQPHNTAYIIMVDDVAVCHLGDVVKLPTVEQIEILKEADVLLVPVGGHCTIGAAEAVEVISQIEPKLVVPMHYATEVSTAELDGVDRFLREMGLAAPEPQPRLTVTRGSLPAEPTVVLLQHRG